MTKTPGREIVARLKRKRELEKRSNVTFRLNDKLVERFRAKCESLDESMTAVLEELINDFLG